MTTGAFYVGDVSQGCPHVEDDSCDLIITSPPYFKQDGYTDALMVKTGKVFGRVLKPGGRAYVVIAQINENLDLPMDAQRSILAGGKKSLIPGQTIIWVKSIAVGGWTETCPNTECGHKWKTEVVSRGHFQPINSPNLMNYCYEFVLCFVKPPIQDAHPLNRKADTIGVGYADKTNVTRWKTATAGVHCPGDVWFVEEDKSDDARWLALAIDTEGSIQIALNKDSQTKSPTYSARLDFSNTHEGLVKRVQEVAGCGSISVHEPKGLGKKPCYVLQISSREAQSVLERIYPHLIVKQKVARCAIALEAGKTRRDEPGYREALTEDEVNRRTELHATAKSLNAGDDVDVSSVPEPRYVVGPTDCWHIPYETTGSTVKKAHRHEFPQELARRLIVVSGIPAGSTVFDPFAGGGTSLFAARECGMNAIGNDINQNAIDLLQQSWDVGITQAPVNQGTGGLNDEGSEHP